MRNLILTGGIRHDFADMADALAGILRAAGISSEITTDIEGGLRRLSLKEFELVTVYALRWRMLVGDKYAPHRDQWAFSLSEAGRRSLSTFVEGGGGLLGLHTAALCFDDWPQWKEILGGTWVWGRSHHPPFGAVEVVATPSPSPLTEGLGTFSLDDEIFSDLDLMADVAPLLVASSKVQSATPSSPQPVFWTRNFGSGRVVYDALGHDRRSLEHTVHARMLQRSALWAMRTVPPMNATRPCA